jgi:uncharacterized protein YbjT (DUF2867 family)
VADLSKLTTPETWMPHLSGIDAVVNASGALQDGSQDNLVAAQDTAIRALIVACELSSVRRFVQISAPGAKLGARSVFLRTKGAADAALRDSGLDWIIFKPGLVISANAYGGANLLRQLAAFPIIQPLVLGDRRIQTVAATEVAAAVTAAVSPTAPLRQEFDLVEDEVHTLAEIVAKLRAWLGFDAALVQVSLPFWLGLLVARFADFAGWLGWRSPLRTTALRTLEHDVLGDPSSWKRHTGVALQSLDQTLAALPATAQERIYARAQLVFPLLVVVLALFWCVSGVIGLWRSDEAVLVLHSTALEPVAREAVLGGALIDIAIGCAILVRPWIRAAAWAAILASLGYLVAGAVLTPQLWIDPLGPFIKVLPGMALALTVAALAQER